jgi:hypothetical protein
MVVPTVDVTDSDLAVLCSRSMCISDSNVMKISEIVFMYMMMMIERVTGWGNIIWM